jgi:opacity protein-like surface antigen
MHVRLVCLALLGAAALPAEAAAQRTADQARLVFTVSLGAVGGKQLWAISPQPVQFRPVSDTFALSRRIRSTFAVGFGGAYFSGDNLGWAVDGFLIGIGFEDGCTHLFSSGSGDVAAACTSIQGSKKPATGVMLSGGPIFRINSRQTFSPYARLNAGLVFTTQSSLRTFGEFTSDSGSVSLVVYDDNKSSRVTPGLGLGAGFTLVIAKGYQLRWEIRDNILGVREVIAPAPQIGAVPPNKLSYKHLFSMTVGFDLVLERRRGRRY